jgi:predicted DNA-binding protein with PD1-like motif
MKWKDNGNGMFLVKIEQGEEIMATLEAFVAQHGNGAALIHGLGAIKDVEIGYFELAIWEYHKRVLPDDLELLSFLGNAVIVEGKPVVHAHVVVSDHTFAAQGGHLFRATIAVTGEFFVQFTGIGATRATEDFCALRLLKLADNA